MMSALDSEDREIKEFLLLCDCVLGHTFGFIKLMSDKEKHSCMWFVLKSLLILLLHRYIYFYFPLRCVNISILSDLCLNLSKLFQLKQKKYILMSKDSLCSQITLNAYEIVLAGYSSWPDYQFGEQFLILCLTLFTLK